MVHSLLCTVVFVQENNCETKNGYRRTIIYNGQEINEAYDYWFLILI